MKLILIRGLLGSGKTTKAKQLDVFHIEADMFFMHDGRYEFDASKIKRAHTWCQQIALNAMIQGMDVVVSNTFTQKWEMQPYLDFAKDTGHEVEIIVMTGNYGNIHNVPQEVIDKMSARWES